jgi:AcrR family transcriptional regulator
MGITERREREREQVRTRILDAAREILSEDGLAGLSMRGIAERIEYSPATIYLYFRDKDELTREIVQQGFDRMNGYVTEEIAELGPRAANALDRYGAMGRAYARFALENTAYFRVMFELPKDAQLICPSECTEASSVPHSGFAATVETVRQAMEERKVEGLVPTRAALIGWGLVHGLTSLYLSGQLAPHVGSNDEFLTLIEDAKEMVFGTWKSGAESVRHGAATLPQ